ncbi:MAG: UDPGP type 1 family protein [Phycisphaera sp.]|nr:UDPGP type 1 family protein [Phycisphaera sp.]
MNITDRITAARATLEKAGQGHVFKHIDSLDDSGRRILLEQVESIDWPEVARLVKSHVLNKPVFELPGDVKPAPWYPYTPPANLKNKYAQAGQLGEQLVREGKVAAFTVAGGQGTRLGWDAPKGTFPATPVRGQTLFGCMAEYLLKTREKFGVNLPWYVMTSPVNHVPTLEFFESQNYFGLGNETVKLFPQAMMPAIDMKTGKALLESPSSLALSPNGHGGSLKALWTSGAIADMKKRGIEQISYTQVDNPIVRVIDPLFIGLHALDRAQMSSKMLPKREPLEKLGNFCLVDGKMTVIEYSDLPDELAHERLPDGSLRFLAGSIALHVIRVDFVERLNTSSDGFALPFHRAEKKVACLDPATGQPIKPDKPNAVKLETFVFDALPFCDASIVYETSRSEEFAPIKNADAPGNTGVLDCPATSKQLQVNRAAKWLEANGVKVPRKPDGTVDAVIEIPHTTATEPGDLATVKLPGSIDPGVKIVI